MESFEFLVILSVILLSTKVLGLLSEKVHMPQVVGALLAGVILGPSFLDVVSETDFLQKTAEIGVIMLMFLAGLDTDLEELKKNGAASLVIALVGVAVPLLGGFFIHILFFGAGQGNGNSLLNAVFTGVVLTATSVSITVETLREMGRLKGRLGTTILGAAIIDDIIGIIVLTFTTSIAGASSSPAIVLSKICIYFIFIACVAFVIRLVSQVIEDNNNKRRISIYAISFCFILSYISEKFFGIADITGAYFAGIMLCTMNVKYYIGKKITIPSYLIFSPVFFASIGIKTSLSGFTGSLVVFTIALTLTAVISKILGCGIGAKFCGFNRREALAIGVGMVSRGEVALIVAQKGYQAGLLSEQLFPPIVIVVIVTTLITPVLLKVVLTGSHDEKAPIKLRRADF